MIPPMQPLPQALYRAEDARELDRIATAELGIASFSLMTRAGEAAFCVVLGPARVTSPWSAVAAITVATV